MSAFHTKTIASVLEPVAQQVSHLVVLYEAGQQGQAMPDLVDNIQLVLTCVSNLATVAESTAKQSNDATFIRDFPSAMDAVNNSSTALNEAVLELRTDPYSSKGRRKLITGAKGILTGTCDLLLMYDESEVRKIVKNCEAVRSYFPVCLEVGTLEDLSFYIKNLTPGLTQVCKAVKNRADELLHKPYADILRRETEQLKKFAPMLIGASKSLINAQGNEELTNAAHQNLDTTIEKMNASMKEIIRVLLMKDPDYGKKIIADFHPLALAKDAVMADCNRVRDWLKHGKLTDAEGLKCATELISAGKELAAGVSGPKGEEIGEVVKAIDGIVNDLKNLGDAGSETDKAALKKALLENVEKLDTLVKNTDVLASTPSGAVSRRIEDAKRWAKSGDNLSSETNANFSDLLTTSRAVAKATSGKEGAMIEKSIDKIEELLQEAGRLELEIGNNKGKADNRARILAWLAQLNNQVKMADEKNILPSEVVNAGVGQLSEWAKDSPAVSDANAHHAYNKVLEVSKAVSEGLSKAERDQVEGLIAEVGEAMESYQAVIQGPTPTHAAIKKSQATLLQAVHKIGTVLEKADMTGDNAAENVTTGVERVCDLVDANKVGASPKVEQSIRQTVDKVAAIGKAVAHHNPGPEGDRINELCDNVKHYISQRTWVINNPEKVTPEMVAANSANIKDALRELESKITAVEQDRDEGTELVSAVSAAQQWASTGKGGDAQGTTAVGKVISQSRYLARGLNTRDKREIFDLCQELEDLIDEYNRAPEGRKRALRSQIADKMNAVKQAARKANTSAVPGTETAGGLPECSEIIDEWLDRDEPIRSKAGERAVEDVIDMAAALAKNIGGPVGEAIKAQTEKVAKLLRHLQDVIDDPKSTPEQKRAAQAELKEAITELKKACNDHLASKVVDTYVDITGPIMELQAAALAPLAPPEKAVKFNAKAADFSLHAEQLCRVAEVATDVGCDEDPHRHDNIKLSIEALRDATPMVVYSAKTLSLNPDSESAKENFDLVKQQWVTEAVRLRTDVDKCVKPTDFLVESERKCKEEGEAAKALMKTSPKEAVVKVAMVQKITNRVLEVTDAELENLGDCEFRVKLVNHRANLQHAIQHAGQATNEHIKGQATDPAAFDKSITEVHMNISYIKEEMVGFYLPLPPLPELIPPPIVEEEEEKPPARPPVPVDSDEEEDAFDASAPAPDPVEAPIEHAAFKLRQETAKYIEEDNDMIAAARKIAQKFQQMAKYTKGRREMLELGATEGDSDSSGREKSEFSSMTDMIKTCKEIIALTKNIQKHAAMISKNCPDKRLVMSLANSMEPIGMLSQQLNIIASVKASASGKYNEAAEVEADEMLTINAQNLMKSVRDTVRASESCSVKMLSNPAANNLQFRRKR
ncbi:vinculin-like isoform X7 [Bolinopsis microptera]|uniref:vinculin-like isoform X6 n=1 Tax=Bolinopsis microptera TaxID=2820187 RepID=UPI003079AF82